MCIGDCLRLAQVALAASAAGQAGAQGLSAARRAAIAGGGALRHAAGDVADVMAAMWPLRSQSSSAVSLDVRRALLAFVALAAALVGTALVWEALLLPTSVVVRFEFV